MINAVAGDVIGSTVNAFHGSDPAYLALLALTVLLIGFRCNSFTHLFSHTLEALIVSAGLFTLYTIAWPQDQAPSSASGWSRAFAGQWDTLMSFSVQRLLGYYVLALLGLTGVFLIKQLITRR